MNKERILAMWSHLAETAFEPGREYKVLRFDENCGAEVFVGMTRSGERCLLLSKAAPLKKPIEKERLRLLYDRSVPGLVLLLSDDSYSDLFDELISSMYAVVKDLAPEQSAVDEFRGHFIKWATFFDSDFESDLSVDAVVGLIGELKILKDLISTADESSVNALLESWRGPYDEAQDFVLEDRLIEVKTIGMRSRQIKISSLHQLSAEPGKEFDLLVNTTFRDGENGQSIGGLVRIIRDRVVLLLGDTSILYKALGQKGLHPKNLEEYEYVRCSFYREDIYDVLPDGFPKLIHNNVLEGIATATYDLSLPALQPFIKSSREY